MSSIFCCRDPFLKWHLLSFSLAIQEINGNPRILPNNITLGYTVYENIMHSRVTYNAVLGLLPSAQETVLNYQCGRRNNLLAVLEGSESDIAIDVSVLLNTYKIPQVSHGCHLAILKDETRFPFFYQMTPTEEPQYLGIVRLLLHFRWTWVGLFAPDSDNGDKFRSTMTAIMLQSGICVAFSESFSEISTNMMAWPKKRKHRMFSFLLDGQVNAFVLYGDDKCIITLQAFVRGIEKFFEAPFGKVWITALLWDSLFSLAGYQRFPKAIMSGSLSFATRTKRKMLYHQPEAFNSLITEFIKQAFDSVSSKPVLSVRGQLRYREKERLEARPWEVLKEHLPPRAYNIYTSVWAVAHALYRAYSYRSEQMMRLRGGRLENDQIQPWQLHPFLRHFQFANISLDGVNLGDNRDQAAGIDIVNVVVARNGSIWSVKVGSLERQASGEIKFTIEQDAIVWPRIKGFSIKGKEFKVSLFANDITVYVSDPQ
ncbi:UNVERIFIED_CONTAM: hypothetical protein K2H54_065140 [Gekko kuhli]